MKNECFIYPQLIGGVAGGGLQGKNNNSMAMNEQDFPLFTEQSTEFMMSFRSKYSKANISKTNITNSFMFDYPS